LPAGPDSAAVGSFVDESEALEILQTLVRVPSVTGSEDAIAEVIASELSGIGCDAVRTREFADGRKNAYGVLKGQGGGPSIMLLGHTDTVHVRGWKQRWEGTPKEDPFGAVVVDGYLVGRGSADQKAGIAMCLEALRALQRSGISLAGDVVCAFVGDEESGEPGSGYSNGIAAVVDDIKRGSIPSAEFAVYTEPTSLAISPAQRGFFLATISVTGKSAYFATPEEGLDAIEGSLGILNELFAYARRMRDEGGDQIVGRRLLGVTGIAGGGSVAVAGDLSIELIRLVLPSETLDQAAEELEQIVRQAPRPRGTKVTVTYGTHRDHPIGGTPVAVSVEIPPVKLLMTSLQGLTGQAPRIEGFKAWSELPFLINGVGIPGVYFGPGDLRRCHTVEESVSVDEFIMGCRVLSDFITKYCNKRG
jgi:acetylornithine deacetylase